MEKKYKVYKRIGKLKKEILDMLNINMKSDVYIDDKIDFHIKRRHGKQLTRKMKKNLSWLMEKILKSPDYISIEENCKKVTLKLIKKFEVNIALVIQLDNNEEYFYVATMYPLREPRVKEKLYRGDLKTLVDKKA